MLNGAVKKRLGIGLPRMAPNSKVNGPFIPHFQKIKDASPVILQKPSFAERWKPILAAHKTYQLLESAKNSVDASGTLSSTKIIQDQNTTRYAIFPKRLAKGGCGAVNIAQNLTTKTFCILKISTDGDDKALGEAAILQKLHLFEGIKLKTDKDGFSKSYLFMKLLPGIAVQDFIQLCKENTQTLSPAEQAQVLLSMLEAIQALIKKHINHGDIHGRNILFDPLTMKTHFIDFGDSTLIPPNGSKNHHQHYDIRHLLKALKNIIIDPSLIKITQQYLYSWTELEKNLQNAIDNVRSLSIEPSEENTAAPIKKHLGMRRRSPQNLKSHILNLLI